MAIAFVGDSFADPLLMQMDGIWERDAIALIVIDTERMLGSASPERPFDRGALILRDMQALRGISGVMVGFDIGQRHFNGVFDGDRLTVAGDGIDGVAVLTRRRR